MKETESIKTEKTGILKAISRFITKIVIVVIFIASAYAVTVNTPYYIEKVHYAKNEIRFIINEEEFTKSLPDAIKIENDNVLLSIDTVKKFFDEYAYFDQKYNTFIVAKDKYVYKMPVDSNVITINGIEKKINTPVRLYTEYIEMNSENGAEKVAVEKVYIPISEFEDLYNIKIEYNEKVIVTTADARYYAVTVGKSIHTKLYQRELALTTERVSKGEELEIFDEGYETKSDEDYIWVRTENGSLGYVKKENIKAQEILKTPIELTDNVKEPKKKISLTWEYAANFTPDRSSERKISSLDIVAPTWVYVKNSSGDLKENVSRSYIAWAESRGYEVWPTIKNDDIGIDNTSLLVTDMYARQAFIDNVIALCEKYDFKGINIDFEFMYMKDRDEYSEFIRELAVELKRKGITSSVDVNVPDGSENWSRCFDSKAISDAVDYTIVMTYDQYGNGSSIAGPVASLAWVENNIIKMIERDGIDSEKLVLGVPYYSRFWRTKDGVVSSTSSLSMAKAKEYMNQNKNSTNWNEEAGQYVIEYTSNGNDIIIYVEDENSLEKKIELINKYNLAGVASWRRGFETEEVWKTIEETLKK